MAYSERNAAQFLDNVRKGDLAGLPRRFPRTPFGLHVPLSKIPTPQPLLTTANFVFAFKTNVPNELIPINPLGLAITYFREDQAVKLKCVQPVGADSFWTERKSMLGLVVRQIVVPYIKRISSCLAEALRFGIPG